MWLYNRLLPVPYSRKWNDGVYLHVYIILPQGDLSTIKERMFEQIRSLWVLVLNDENLPTLPFVILDERPIRHDGENLPSSIPKIIPARKIEKIPTKREKNIIEQSRNWCSIVMNQRKTLKFLRLLRLRRKEIMERIVKPTFNYDIAESNQLIKLGFSPIGCGIGDKDGRPYIVFRSSKLYFDARDLIRFRAKYAV